MKRLDVLELLPGAPRLRTPTEGVAHSSWSRWTPGANPGRWRARASDDAFLEAVRAGALFDGAYRVLETIGRGGMGIVLRARDERLERDVAIKILNPASVAPDARTRFLKEARTMAHVRHPNVVEVHAFGEVDGAPYFVMEYVAGHDLEASLLCRPSPLPVDEALGTLEQVCRGVSAVHAVGAVHRDIKPSNILIAPSFRVAVTDLGLVEGLGDRSCPTPFVGGTPGFMAPEVAMGLAVPPELAQRADVYSLGVLAFELLTGQAPFHAHDAASLLGMHCYSDAPRPSETRPDLPRAFDEAILGALVRDPRGRFASAEELRQALFAARDKVAHSYSDRTVLVADDDPGSRSYVADVLRVALPAAHIECAGDGLSALATAREHPVSLAVIDLEMPGMNGVELTAALRGEEHTQDTPIVVLTAFGGSSDWRLLQRLGASGFLVKPVDPTTLGALARRFVDPHASRRRPTSMLPLPR